MKMTKLEIEHLILLCGIAINVNDGQCQAIEEALTKATTLCCQVLDDMEERKQDQ